MPSTACATCSSSPRTISFCQAPWLPTANSGASRRTSRSWAPSPIPKHRRSTPPPAPIRRGTCASSGSISAKARCRPPTSSTRRCRRLRPLPEPTAPARCRSLRPTKCNASSIKSTTGSPCVPLASLGVGSHIGGDRKFPPRGLMETMLQGAAPQAVPADLIKDSDQTKFAKDVLETSRTVPVIVDFWAPWCGPCKTLQPMIEKVVKEAKGKVKLVKIDIDKNQMLAQQLRIQSIPAVYAFFGGRPVDGFMGAVPESEIKAFIDRLIQSSGGATADPGAVQVAELLEQAKAAVAQNDMDTAAQVYSEILGAEPANVTALAGLARYQVSIGDMEQAKELLAQIPAKEKTHADVVVAQAAIELAEKAKEAGPVDELKAKAAANPKDFQSRLDLAMAYWAGDQKQEAIDELLSMIRLDRVWNEGAARQQLLKFFEALGFSDPLSVDGRKRLSTILFS